MISEVFSRTRTFSEELEINRHRPKIDYYYEMHQMLDNRLKTHRPSRRQGDSTIYIGFVYFMYLCNEVLNKKG